jgi:hypothetical protein
VLIAFDRDDAGERGSAKVAERLMAEGFDCYRIEFPKGLDANAYALKLTPPSRSLGLMIRKAAWLGKGDAPAAPTTTTAAGDVPPSFAAAKENDGAPLIETESEIADAPPASSLVADFDPLPASVLPAMVTAEPEAQIGERDITISFAQRRYRVRGFDRNLAVDVRTTSSTSIRSISTAPRRGRTSSRRRRASCG